MATKIDKLFALKALEQKITEERELLEYECRDELIAAFNEEGTDRRTSPLFGPDAGKFSIKRYKAEPGKTVTEFELVDDEAFAGWLEENQSAVFGFAKLHATDLAKWWLDSNGEMADGIEVTTREEEGKPERLSAQIYSLKPDMVLDKLGGNFLAGANELLLEGDSE